MRRKYTFTLLELIIACTIVAVMTALGGAVIYSFPRSYKELEAQASRLEFLLKMDGYADNIVRNAVPVYWKDGSGAEKQIFYGDKDVMFLASRNHISAAGGMIFSVFGKRKDQIVVQYRNTPLLYWEKDEEEIMPETITEEIVASGVSDLQLYYGQWENGKLKWLEDWNEKDKGSTPALPPVIAWTITFEDGSSVHYIRRTSGNSYYTSYGRIHAEKK